MSVATYNLLGANGLTELQFANSGYVGKLSATGNTVRTMVGVPDAKTIGAFPAARWPAPGGHDSPDWNGLSSQRTLSVGARPVLWVVTLKATSAANLNLVEGYVEKYLEDAGVYELTDAWGRSSNYAVMDPSRTRRVGPRILVGGAAQLQKWEIGFMVLRPTLANPVAF